MQRKCRTSWSNSCWKSKSSSSLSCFHVFLLHIRSALILLHNIFLNNLSYHCTWFLTKISFFFSGKFGAFFASIPLPIFAAIYCVLYGLVGECPLINLLSIAFITYPTFLDDEGIYVFCTTGDHELSLSHLFGWDKKLQIYWAAHIPPFGVSLTLIQSKSSTCQTQYSLISDLSDKSLTSFLLIQQLRLELHLFNSQTIIQWETSTYWDYLYS